MKRIYFTLLLLGSAGVAKAAVSHFEITADNVERTYRLYIPDSLDTTQPAPLVFNFHGTGGTPERQAGLSDLESVAAKDGFIVISPQAVFRYQDDSPQTWNVEKKPGVDDVNFVQAMIREVSEQYAIDAKRIYATGFSGGARMSSRLACDLSDTIAAIAPVAGVRFPDDCEPTRAVPVMTFHGTQDPVNTYELKPTSPPYWHMGVDKAIAGWVNNNECKSAPVIETLSATLEKQTYQCKAGANIIFYRSTTAGHTWPGSKQADVLTQYGLGETEALPASSLIADFFYQHPME